jgi:hypothetical protein
MAYHLSYLYTEEPPRQPRGALRPCDRPIEGQSATASAYPEKCLFISEVALEQFLYKTKKS